MSETIERMSCRIIAILRGDFRGREEEIVAALHEGGLSAVEMTRIRPPRWQSSGVWQATQSAARDKQKSVAAAFIVAHVDSGDDARQLLKLPVTVKSGNSKPLTWATDSGRNAVRFTWPNWRAARRRMTASAVGEFSVISTADRPPSCIAATISSSRPPKSPRRMADDSASFNAFYRFAHLTLLPALAPCDLL